MAETKKEAEKNEVLCPLCGKPGYEYPDIPEQVKEEFLIAMLANTPFTRTYSIMDGKILTTVKAMSEKDKRAKVKLMIKVSMLCEPYQELYTYRQIISNYIDMVCQIKSVDIKSVKSGQSFPFDIDGSGKLKEMLDKNWDGAGKDFNTAESFLTDMVGELTDVITSVCGVPIQLLMACVTKHNDIIGRLISACLDKNFIEGIGH